MTRTRLLAAAILIITMSKQAQNQNGTTSGGESDGRPVPIMFLCPRVGGTAAAKSRGGASWAINAHCEALQNAKFVPVMP
jgi:hypothetical protein